MKEIKKEFPNKLKRKIISKINKRIKISFYNGADIKTDMFNISILEPYKIIFTYNKKKSLYMLLKKK